MKRTYICPKTEVVSVKLQGIIAASGDRTLGVGSDYNGSATIEASSYRNSLWSDDE
ncbi:MAG: hypothetical protein IJP70_02295 [Bacteroidales bacterium]|nr:hypothetical protein [Bacteroidales bacterium]